MAPLFYPSARKLGFILPHRATYFCNRIYCLQGLGAEIEKKAMRFGHTFLEPELHLPERRVPLPQSFGCTKLSLLQSDAALIWLLRDRGYRKMLKRKKKLGNSPFFLSRQLPFPISQARSRELQELASLSPSLSALVPTSSIFIFSIIREKVISSLFWGGILNFVFLLFYMLLFAFQGLHTAAVPCSLSRLI